MVRFGQVVVGPPGSGKTTYCHGMFQYLKAIGRDAAVINLDPANHGESLPYKPDLDIEDLVSLEVKLGTTSTRCNNGREDSTQGEANNNIYLHRIFCIDMWPCCARGPLCVETRRSRKRDCTICIFELKATFLNIAVVGCDEGVRLGSKRRYAVLPGVPG